MTISGPAVPVFCMYLVAAERQGVDLGKLNGTLQTDIFKEYIAQKEWLFAPEPHLRLIGDLMEYCAENIPAYKPISVSGYHIREAGSTAAQELAYTLADGFAYVELGLSRGLDIEQFAPGLSFFFDAHLDFFEEIAKFRAARRIWARWLRDVYGATTDKAQQLRFHTQTAGRLADRPAAGQQHRPDGGRGAGRGPRRHPVAAHQRPRRGAGAAERQGRPDRAAHPAGDHGGDRRHERRRPARRLLVRRGAHRRDGAPGRGDLRPHQGHERRRHDDRRASCAASRTAGSPARSPRPRSSTSGRWRRATRRSSASTPSPARWTRTTRWTSCGSATRSSATRRPSSPSRRQSRDDDAARAAVARMVEVGRTEAQHDPGDAGRRPRRGDPRRDLRRPARRVGQLHRARPLLASLHRGARPARTSMFGAGYAGTRTDVHDGLAAARGRGSSSLSSSATARTTWRWTRSSCAALLHPEEAAAQIDQAVARFGAEGSSCRALRRFIAGINAAQEEMCPARLRRRRRPARWSTPLLQKKPAAVDPRRRRLRRLAGRRHLRQGRQRGVRATRGGCSS